MIITDEDARRASPKQNKMGRRLSNNRYDMI
jgi:hypothetical protein